MPDALWQLDQLQLGARLCDITLAVQPGITAIMGQSGAGKTSLLNILVGFESPTRGGMRFNPPAAATLPLYWSPQDAGLWPHLCAREHIQQVAASGSDDILERFDLADRANAHPHELSQGERARLSVARALASRAAVLVMDEPLAHVDPQRVGRYWRAILDHVRDTGASLVFATHQPRRALAHADRVVCMDAGRVLHHGDAQELYHHPPDEHLAAAMGECNWLEPNDAKHWLGVTANGTTCYRPERIAIEPDDGGCAIVRDSRFHGDVAEVELQHVDTDESRTFYHRPARDALAAGQRVVIRVLTMLLMFTLIACNRSESVAMDAHDMHIWSVPPVSGTMPRPRHIEIDERDRVIVLDTAGRVLIYNDQGDVVRQWDMPTSEAGNPEGTCALKDGRIAVADTHYSRVVFFDPDGNVLSTIGSDGAGPGQFRYPVSIVQDDDENIYVCEYGGNDRVQKFTTDGQYILAFGGNGTKPGEFQRASGMVYRDGRIYIADAINNRIQVFDTDGNFIAILGGTDAPALNYPYDLGLCPDGTLLVIEYGAARITRLSMDGELLGRFGGPGRGLGEFATPWSIGVDSQGRVRVADTGNHRIVELKL